MDADTGTPRTAESVPGTTRVGYGRRPTRADMALTFGTLALMLTAVTLRQGHEEFPGPASPKVSAYAIAGLPDARKAMTASRTS